MLLFLPVDDPVGVEDLVPAVFRIRLGEHHQLHVGGIARQRGECVEQVVNLVRRQGQAHALIGFDQCRFAVSPNIHYLQRRRCMLLEQYPGIVDPVHYHLGHAIMDQALDWAELCSTERVVSRTGELP